MSLDPISTAVGGELARAGGGVLGRLFGPTADVIGAQLEAWYSKRYVRRVIDRADEISSNGTIPLRVAAEVFEKAQWAEDEFVAEYLSGVLAGARTPEGRDDRGIAWTALIGRMSSDQLRLHYILLRALREHLVSDGGMPDALEQEASEGARTLSDLLAGGLVVHLQDAQTALCGEGLSTDQENSRLVDALYGLDAEGLIESGSMGPGRWLNTTPNAMRAYPDDWDVFRAKITIRGARLVMQAVGLGDVWPTVLADPSKNPLERLSLSQVPDVRSVAYESLPFKKLRTTSTSDS